MEAEAVLGICGRVLAEIRPAATIVIVAGLLRPEMKVEIEVTALLP
jgi:enamine deaminase RidA (YjgF/YER057c/UK114 family)